MTTPASLARDPGLYGSLPYDRRPAFRWPEQARVALWVAPNIEFYELKPPANPQRSSWPRPWPDVLNYSWRDYGNRVGFRRMLELMVRNNVRGTVSLNVAVCDHHPEIVRACADAGWEFFSHGIYNTRYMYGLDEAQERAVIQDSMDAIRQHTGQRMDGWLAPALSYTERSMELLADMGVQYVADLFHDDQPTPLNTASGALINVPYSIVMNDYIVFSTDQLSPFRYAEMLKRQFDCLYEEGADSGTVMCIPLHPYLMGTPHRLEAFDEALRYICSHAGVWKATGREIARHFRENCYEQFLNATNH